ncbi:MAG TPA: Xaa-Pro peptidase family protein [Candidatus Limnocylindria bacterium]|nr:Xaa-Pro peptidase family protein [Candidatus Limnocylindria bacterium]
MPPFPPSVHRERLARAARAAGEREIDAILVTPSADYRYLLGYDAPPLERLTCLIVRPEAAATLVLPHLEEPLARHELGSLADEMDLRTWEETEDPFALVGEVLGRRRRVAVQDQMWARFVLRLGASLEGAELVEAGPALSVLRRTKSSEEVERLRTAAEAADRAMDAITSQRLSGRTEAAVAAVIRELLRSAGHDEADWAIVASGPNAASPHHTPGDRLIAEGDSIVLDIGGALNGYASDTTRTAFVGVPPEEFQDLYAVLQEAQAAACDAVKPGIAARDVDRVAREIITDAGYGPLFTHRTGHGIGMETHEEPYLVESNPEPLREGDAFSVEPGIYVDGRWGARIEDIVVCTADGGERLNRSSRDLRVVA